MQWDQQNGAIGRLSHTNNWVPLIHSFVVPTANATEIFQVFERKSLVYGRKHTCIVTLNNVT